MVTIFQVITMEGWVDIMYMITDTSNNILTVPFFCLIIIIGSFFLLNLILAVIMRVFTQNDEAERIKYKKNKILEETKNLRKNPREYLKPLNTVSKMKRSMSAKYRQKYQSIGMATNKEPQLDKNKKNYAEAKINKSKSNYFDIGSPRKFKGNNKEEDSPEYDNKEILKVEFEEEKENVIEMFEMKKLNEIDLKGFPINVIPNPTKKVPLTKEQKAAKVQAIRDKFIKLMGNFTKPTRRLLDSPKKLNLLKSLSQNSNYKEERDKLFEKIMLSQNSRTSEEQSEFKIDSQHSVMMTEESAVKESYSGRKGIFLSIALSTYFQFIIMGSILINTILLCMERYPMSKKEQDIQEYFNIVFTFIFAVEMVIKIIAFGVKGYLRDKFNQFDSLIVVVSIADLTFSTVFEFNVEAGGAISAFRIFRLFRVIKLIKSWKRFQKLITTIVHSIKDVSNFSILLFLFIFIYTLLGRELFAYNIKFNEEGNFTTDKNAKSPRQNFDTFVNAIITIFIVLTGEQWNLIMYNAYFYQKYIALFFFISLVMIGQMILLNLFLAILLENFNVDEQNKKKEVKTKSLIIRLQRWIDKKFKAS